MDQAQADQLAADLMGKDIDGWTIEGRCGNGKSAVVMKASRAKDVAALKIFHPELIERYGKDAQLERVAREKALVGQEHPNLVKIFAGGVCPVSGYVYVAMEYLPYKTLNDELGKVEPSHARALISQVASAARFLEDLGIAHRDIKPENIAVTPDLSRAILLDLGVIRPIGNSDLTDVDQRLFIGTLRYSSPEFLLRQEADTLEGWRSLTFYQLGATLHDMLMHRPLFEEFSEPYARLVHAIEREKPKITSVDKASVMLANRCLLKDPEVRHQLVAWTDFNELDISNESTLTAARDRIRARQQYSAAVVKQAVGSEAKELRLRHASISEFMKKLEARIAQEINRLKYFPPRSSTIRDDDDGESTELILRFATSEAFGILHQITIVLKVRLLHFGNDGAVFEISTACGFGDVSVVHELDPSPLTTGLSQDVLDSPKLEVRLTQYLDGYYTEIENTDVKLGHFYVVNINDEE